MVRFSTEKILVLILHSVFFFSFSAHAQNYRLGNALQTPLIEEETPSLQKKSEGKNASTGVLSRQDVVDLYHDKYLTAFGSSINWTGSVNSCNAGTVNAMYRQGTLQMVNYYRTMVGLPDVSFDDVLNAKAQEAALMMIAEGNLSHFPPPSWACYSADGAEAAGKANIALGNHGASAIVAYIRDSGNNNEAVGHRRWILYPRQVVMGSGSTDGRNNFYLGSNALWVLSSFGSRASNPEWIAWPPEGFAPYHIVYPRWSISKNASPGADFSNATVEMNVSGNPIQVEILPIQNGFGDNTLVWEPTANSLPLHAGMEDLLVSVTLRNVRINGRLQDYSYEVTIIDPDLVVADTIPPTISDCPISMTIPNDLGQCSASASWKPPTATDNVGVTSFNSSHMPGDVFAAGSTEVSYTARDRAGNESVCAFSILVLDQESPERLLCPEDQSFVHSDPERFPVPTLPIPQFTDNCGIKEISSTHDGETEFPLGQSIVVFTAEDTSENTSTCIYSIEIGFELHLEQGWNLLSVPVVPDQNLAQQVGDIAVGDVYWVSENGEYISVDALEPYKGYWLYASQSADVLLTGDPPEDSGTHEFELTTGWNLLAPVHPISIPNDIFSTTSIWFWQEGNYHQVLESNRILGMGKSYWIKSPSQQSFTTD